MRRNELDELHYIAHIDNIQSIERLGILSHRGAARVRHESVAKEAIQRRRAQKPVPGGRPLHEYVNLYICARNKMLYLIQNRHRELCVLRINPDVIDLPGAIVADRNASSDHVRFEPAPRGLRLVDRNLVFAEYWTHPDDPIQEMRHGSIKCAEVLVPDRVAPGFIIGAYVSCDESLARFHALGVGFAATANPHLFFR